MKYRIRKRVTKKIVITEAINGHKYSKLEAKTEYYAQEKVMWGWWRTIGWRTIGTDKFNKFGNFTPFEYFQYKDDCKEFIKQYHYLHYGMGENIEIIN